MGPLLNLSSAQIITPDQSGKSSPWYKAVQENLTLISDAIRQAPSALGAVTLKFVEKGWIRGGDNLTPDQICTMALGRIELDANQFGDFVDILKDTRGMDIIAHTLECTFTTTVLVSQYLSPSNIHSIEMFALFPLAQ